MGGKYRIVRILRDISAKWLLFRATFSGDYKQEITNSACTITRIVGVGAKLGAL